MDLDQALAWEQWVVVAVDREGAEAEAAAIGPEVEVEVAEGMVRLVAEAEPVAEEEEARIRGGEGAAAVVEDFGHIS